MSNDVKFEGKERRIAGIIACMAEYGIKDLEEARQICLDKGIDPDAIVKGIQPIAFENAASLSIFTKVTCLISGAPS